MVRRSVLAVLVAVLFAAAIPHGRLEARNPNAATKTMSPIYYSGGLTVPTNIVPKAMSVVSRNDSGVAMQIHTRGLNPGHAYTAWWIIFNDPDGCEGEGGCGLADFGARRGSPAMAFAAGHVVGANGVGNFAGSRKVGDMKGPGFGSLQNPRGAEVHLVIVDHGMMDPQLMPAQISTPGPGVQYSIHQP